jgi:hypothetical protein
MGRLPNNHSFKTALRNQGGFSMPTRKEDNENEPACYSRAYSLWDKAEY